MSFAVFFTSIGNAGFKGSSLGASGNFDCGPYGFGKGSPYYNGPPEPEIKLGKMELPVYLPILQRDLPAEIETCKLELREEYISLKMRYEHSFKGLGIETKDSFEYNYNKKTSLLDIIRERRR